MNLSEKLKESDEKKRVERGRLLQHCKLLQAEALGMFEKLRQGGFSEKESEAFMMGNGFIPPTFNYCVHCNACGWMPDREQATSEGGCSWCKTEIGAALQSVFVEKSIYSGKSLRSELLRMWAAVDD